MLGGSFLSVFKRTYVKSYGNRIASYIRGYHQSLTIGQRYSGIPAATGHTYDLRSVA